MKSIFTTAAALLFGFVMFAQPDSEKTNYYFDADISETQGISLSVKNPVSRYNFAKFELVIENNSEDFVYFLAEENELGVEGKRYSTDAKRNPQICEPGKKISPTLKFEGGGDFLADKMNFYPGGIYTFEREGKIAEGPDFKMPASKNVIEAGPFEIQMKRLKQETQETAVKFKVIYTGDLVGLVSMSKAAVRTPDGNLWANVRTGLMYDVFMKGDSKSYTLIFEVPAKQFDMQFTELFIVWGETFSEAELIPLDFGSGEITIDEITTREKNK